jgi:hypothetical protein
MLPSYEIVLVKSATQKLLTKISAQPFATTSESKAVQLNNCASSAAVSEILRPEVFSRCAISYSISVRLQLRYHCLTAVARPNPEATASSTAADAVAPRSRARTAISPTRSPAQ